MLIAIFLPVHPGIRRYCHIPCFLERVERFKRKMFVGGLNWDTTDGT